MATVIFKRGLTLVTCIACLVMLTSCVAIDKHHLVHQLVYDVSRFKNGDIIFRRGVSMVSTLILSADEQAEFSHAGIIYKKGEQTFVIHSMFENSATNTSDTVRIEPIVTFLQPSMASAMAVYRLRDVTNVQQTQIVETSLRHVDNQTRFDLGFDLRTEDDLYCTEFVWRVYQTVGIDLVEGNFAQLSMPFSDVEDYILPSTLTQSRFLKLVDLDYPTVTK